MAKAPAFWIACFYGIPVVVISPTPRPSPRCGRDPEVASHSAKPTGVGGRQLGAALLCS